MVAALVARLGTRQLGHMLGQLRWSFLEVSLIYSAHQGVRALALWRCIVGPPVRFGDVLRVRLSGETIEVLTLTGPFLAEPSKAWLLTRRGLSISAAFAAVATEYLLYTAVSAGLVVLAISLLMAQGGRSHETVVAVVISLAFIGAIAFAALTGVGVIVPLVRASGTFIGRARATRLTELIRPVEQQLVSFLHEHQPRLVEVFTWEIVGHALLLSEVWIVLRALNLQFVAADPLIIEGGSKMIASAFFFIPSQVGAFEAVYVALFGAVGLPAVTGLTLALVRRARGLVVAGLSLALLAWFGEPGRP